MTWPRQTGQISSTSRRAGRVVKRSIGWEFGGFSRFSVPRPSRFLAYRCRLLPISEQFSKVEAAFAFGFVGMLTILGIALTGILAERFPRHIVATGAMG